MTIGKRRNRGGSTHTSIDDVAGNGLIHRRALLGRGLRWPAHWALVFHRMAPPPSR